MLLWQSMLPSVITEAYPLAAIFISVFPFSTAYNKIIFAQKFPYLFALSRKQQTENQHIFTLFRHFSSKRYKKFNFSNNILSLTILNIVTIIDKTTGTSQAN